MVRMVDWKAGVLVLAALSLGACAANFTVPKNIEGDVPLTVVHDAETNISEFRIVPENAKDPGPNWLGMLMFEQGQAKTLKLKPGKYTVVIDGPAIDGRFPLSLVRASELRIVAKPTNATPPAGVELHTFVVHQKPAYVPTAAETKRGACEDVCRNQEDKCSHGASQSQISRCQDAFIKCRDRCS